MIFAFAAASCIACVDWWAVLTERRTIESVAKPMVMVALIVAALGVDANPESSRWWIVAGLGLGLVGDICLLPHVDRFIEGLSAFLLGHVFYIVGFVQMFDGSTPLIIGFAAAMVLAVAALPILASMRGHKLQIPVAVYMAVVMTMTVFGVATGRWPIAIGTILFAVSDAVLGANRFIETVNRPRVTIHVLYHIGQAGLVLGLAQHFA